MFSRIFQAIAALLITASFFSSSGAFDLQGHRGARGLLPENTLPAFAKALSIGVTTLELDTGVTKDGHVVVSHNPSLDPSFTRSPDGSWIEDKSITINALTLKELEKYDVGRINPDSRLAKRFGEQVPVDGTKIPTLEAVFELAKKSGNSQIQFNIETKINPLKPEGTDNPDLFVKRILGILTKWQLTDRATIQSFDWRTLQAAQNQSPGIKTVYLTAQQPWLDNVGTGAATDWTAGFARGDYESLPEMIKKAGGSVWSPFFKDLTSQTLKQAQSLGLKVVVWTVNRKEDMEALIDMGVDGIISDYPDRLRAVSIAKGLTVPAPSPVSP